MMLSLPARLLGLLGAVVVGSLLAAPGCGDAARGDDPVRGRYVEVRCRGVVGTLSAEDEASEAGRRAILGFHLGAGAWEGVSLAGVSVAAAVQSSERLEAGAARRSVVYLDARLDVRTRRAAESWLAARHGAALGEILAVRAVEVEVVSEDGVFHVRAGDRIVVSGEALADRSCCEPPEGERSRPLAAGIGKPLLGNAGTCRFEGDSSLPAWSHVGPGNAFVGCFRERCCAEPDCCGSAEDSLSGE